MIFSPKVELYWRKIFELGVLIKGFNGLWETALGWAVIMAHTKIFVGIYLLAHGIINLFLSIQLYRDKLGAYIATIILLSVFMIYQIYRIILHHSIILILITFADILFIILTWHEYNYQLQTRLNRHKTPNLTL